MKNVGNLIVLFIAIFSITLLISNAIAATPTISYTFNQNSVRPGATGTITVDIQNIDKNPEKDFSVCITPVGASTTYISGSCDTKTITFLKTGDKGTVTSAFAVTNEAPSPNSYAASITVNYQQDGTFGYNSASTSQSVSISVSGISIKSDANQRLGQAQTQISAAQTNINLANGAITTAQNMISSAGPQYKDVSNANDYLSSAQSSYSSAQSYLSNAQTKLSQAQSSYNQNSYQASLTSVQQAQSDADSANGNANNAYQSALSAQTAVTNAPCVSGYTLTSGQCVKQKGYEPSKPAYQPPESSSQQTSGTTDSANNSIIYFVIVLVVVGAVAIIYYKKRPKSNLNDNKLTGHHRIRKKK